jgi:hypothetical protein
MQHTKYSIPIIIRVHTKGEDDFPKYMDEKGTDDGKITDARL